MRELHLPWLELTILVPLIGSAVVALIGEARDARKWCLVFTAVTFFATIGVWEDFATLHTFQAHDHWDLTEYLFGVELLVVDELSAPLLPVVAMLYVLTAVATLRTQMRRFSFSWTLVSEAITLSIFSCKEPWLLIALLTVRTIPLYLELRARGKPTGVYVAHMALLIVLLIVGWYIVEAEGRDRLHSLWAIGPLLVAIFIRTGIAPFHCWMTDLFENATFGSSLLFAAPVVGAYAAVRLVLPVADDQVLHLMGLVSIATSVYAAGMALVQREARRFFCYILLSHTSLILVGLESVSKIGLTGALCVWLSTTLSLGGFGLTLRALEARRGRLSLGEFQGLYEHTPALGVCFLLTGLASVGFPGTLGFIGTEMLLDGTLQEYSVDYPYVGYAVVAAAALNGIAVVRAYFYLFTGTRYSSTVSLQIGPRERFSVLVLAALILGGGFLPQPGVASRYHAAVEILKEREKRLRDAATLSQQPDPFGLEPAAAQDGQ